MKKYISLIIIILIIIVFFVGASFLYKKLSENYTPAEIEKTDIAKYKKAQDFTVLNYEGNEVNLSDFIGKPIVLNFWAIWCPPCKSELSIFNKLYEEMNGEVQFLMIDLTDGVSDTIESDKQFILQSGYKFPVYFDVNEEVVYRYNLYSIPRTIFIDKEGNIITSYTGAISEVNLRRCIDKILEN